MVMWLKTEQRAKLKDMKKDGVKLVMVTVDKKEPSTFIQEMYCTLSVPAALITLQD